VKSSSSSAQDFWGALRTGAYVQDGGGKVMEEER